MRIFLIDDDPADRALVRRTLARDMPDADIHEIGTPDVFEAALAGPAPDVVVVDFSLGWATGLDLFKRLRVAHPTCGVVMFTGSLGEEGAVDMMKAGLDDYVVKDPSRLPRLSAAVASLARQANDRLARRRAEARHQALFHHAGVGLFACLANGCLMEANPALRRMTGLGRDEQVDQLKLPDLLEGEGLEDAWAALDRGGIQGLEVRMRRDGQDAFALLDAHRVPEANGEVEGVLTEVTALRLAITRGEVLLREVYHRVYNNLQVVDAFLSLQGRRFRQPEVRGAFQEVAERLRALSLIQQRLYRGDDFETLAFDGYLRDLADTIAGSQNRGEIRVDVQAESLRLQVETAIPLGLVATELLTNAFKHAYPGGRPGTVRITLTNRGREAVLEVADDGVGSANDPYQDPGPSAGIGSTIVPQLAEQVDGRLDSRSGDGGTVVSVTFPTR